mmetsp:Transcript_2377/g.7958  ORF Transcript_2377/g.7958 Transcript_2377/m.7958 type:complete len:388 (-) Transcript_2377:1196-2359(-)
MADTTPPMMPAFLATVLTTAVKRAMDFMHESVNSGMDSEFQLSSVKPLSREARIWVMHDASSSNSTGESEPSTSLYAASIACSDSTYPWYLASCSVTLSAVSGTAKPIRSRYFDSRTSTDKSEWKLTLMAAPRPSATVASSGSTSWPSSSATKMGALSSAMARALTPADHSSKSRCSYFRISLDTATNFLETACPASVLSSSPIGLMHAIVRRIRRNSACAQLMAPATGGWFLQAGGACWCCLKSAWTVSISTWYCCRMSIDLDSISFCPAALESWISLNFWRRLYVSSAVRSLRKESSIKCLTISSILATLSRNLASAVSHEVEYRRSNRSNGTNSSGATAASTRTVTSVMPAAFPVTAVSSGPSIDRMSRSISATVSRSAHRADM